jgi:diacylglycerol O-acyltransferase / wax synthase
MSYRDGLAIGLTGDESVEDLDVLARGIESELALLSGDRA